MNDFFKHMSKLGDISPVRVAPGVCVQIEGETDSPIRSERLYELSEKGREWNRLDRERHALGMLQADADARSGDIFEDETPKSWRVQIVDEEIAKDGDIPVGYVGKVCPCAVQTGKFFTEKGAGYLIYTCEQHHKEYMVKRGERHGA